MSKVELAGLVDRAERLCRDMWGQYGHRQLSMVLDVLRDAELMLYEWDPRADATQQDENDWEDCKESWRNARECFENERDGKPTSVVFPLTNNRIGLFAVIKPGPDGKWNLTASGHHDFDVDAFNGGSHRMEPADD